MARKGCKYGRRADGRCRKKPRRAKSKKCQYGKLKNPRGRRVCRKRPRGRR